MPLSRDPRDQRRRRVLLDANQERPSTGNSRTAKTNSASDDPSSARRGAGYSQDVRKACGARLVQLIPVRWSSYLALTTISIAIPALLLTAHYMIYVSGSLAWYGHPLVVALDASDRRGIAAWLSSQLWILCLGATVLIFQLRKHKLDDFTGEYRLWFWMVLTCLFASIDATTHISDLFGLALNRWCQLNLGWSGPAVVRATMATLVGLLGVRLCSELKGVPTSVLFWLGGLVAWAGSAALAQEELRLNLSLQMRIWLKSSLWLGGLTCIWLAALTYLRSVYIEAQQRFLARSKLSKRHTMRERLQASRQHLRETGQRWKEKIPGMRGRELEEEERVADRAKRSAKKPSPQKQPKPTARPATTNDNTLSAQARATASTAAASGNADTDAQGAERPRSDSETRDKPSAWNRLKKNPFRRSEASKATRQSIAEQVESHPTEPQNPRPQTDRQATPDNDQKRRFGLGSLLKRPKNDDDADEYKKVKRNASPERSSKTPSKSETSGEKRKGWFRSRMKEDAPNDAPREKKSSTGFFSRFRLQPPDDETTGQQDDLRAVKDGASLPSTEAQDYDQESNARSLTKAERRRLRRQRQKQGRAA